MRDEKNKDGGKAASLFLVFHAEGATTQRGWFLASYFPLSELGAFARYVFLFHARAQK